MSSRTLNAPNTLTMFRVLLAPVLVYLLLNHAYAQALVVFLLAGASDGLDGFLARRLNQRTAFGAVLDPVADKLVILSTLLMLAAAALLPLWVVAAILGRDVIIIGGAAAYRWLRGGLEVAPTLLGKAHTFLEFGMLSLVLGDAGGVVDGSRWLPGIFLVIFGTATLSCAQYVWIWGRKATSPLEHREGS